MIDFSQLNNSKIGILGFGYIGSNVYKYLTNLKDCNLEIIILNKENYTLVETENFDYFINCAGNSGDFRSNILSTIESNIGLLCYLLKHLKIRKSYLALSSTRVYGFNSDKTVSFCEENFSEQNHLGSDYIYDGSKKMIESILSNYSLKVNYDIKIVRLSNVYGRFNQLDDTTLIKKIIRSRIDKNILSVNANKLSTKDYIYIDDAIIGITRVLLHPGEFEIYNIGSGESYSLKDISEMIDLQIEFIEDKTNEYHSRISIRKAQENLGFNPQLNIRERLNKIINKKE